MSLVQMEADLLGLLIQFVINQQAVKANLINYG